MIRQERGNALLVGVGGCGKQSLTRLASHMCGYRCFEIELSRGYNYDSFHEDLRRLYKLAGVQGNDMVFLFTDTQVGHRGAATPAGGNTFSDRSACIPTATLCSEGILLLLQSCDASSLTLASTNQTSGAEKTQRLQYLTLCVVDCGGRVLGGHKQHAELWRGAQSL